MVLKNLGFQYGPLAHEYVQINGNALQAMRATSKTLEFPYTDTAGNFGVVWVCGTNLELLCPRILDNQFVNFEKGRPLPHRPEVVIESIRTERDFSQSSGPMAPERNKVRAYVFVVDTGKDRWYLPFEGLVFFGVGKHANDCRYVAQFKPDYSFTMLPRGSDDKSEAGKAKLLHEFQRLLSIFKHTKFELGTTNKMSPFPDYYYRPSGNKDRYLLGKILFKKQDVGSAGEWSMIIDNRRLLDKAPKIKRQREAPSIGM